MENLTLTGSADINGTGNALANTIIGNSGNNVLTGGGDNDALEGGGGNDTLDGGPAPTRCSAESGNDTYVVDDALDVVTEAADEGTDAVQASITYTLGDDVENLTLTGSADINGTGNALANTIIGNSGNNVLTGGGDNDALEGGGGNDTLDGGTGADTMLGGIGNDTYVVDDALDVVTEAADEGTDAVQASITYTLGDDVENLTLTGSADINGTGNALANTIIGNSANNTLDGGAGADTMSGGAGDDIYLVDNIGDTVMENADEGTDAVISTVSYTLGDDIEILQLEGSANLTGTGNALDNVIFSNSGVDTLVGGTGNDIYYVHNAADQVVESAGEGTDTVYTDKSYTLADNVENLALLAATGITATGNSLANTITGNDFGSTLDGGGGADIEGNGGNDVFVFHVGQADGDIIGDFNGNGAAAGDLLRFVGYGSGATFTNIDVTHWQINYAGGTSHEGITFSNAASIHASDFLFV